MRSVHLIGRMLAVWALAAAAAAAPLEQHLAVCAGCHGRDGNSDVPDHPRLAGLDAEYLFRQLKHFKSGARKSPVMTPMVAALAEPELRALADYFSEQKPAAPAASPDASLIEQGRRIFRDGIPAKGVPACAGCHGEDASGDAKYPRLAGQHARYTERQLQSFRSGERSNDSGGLMRAVAQRMDDGSMRAVAHYLAAMKGD